MLLLLLHTLLNFKTYMQKQNKKKKKKKKTTKPKQHIVFLQKDILLVEN